MTMMEHNQAFIEGRRLRAPTITIDTSAALVSQVLDTHTTNDIIQTARDRDDTRHCSPHNASLPISRFGDQSRGLLTVPETRSRFAFSPGMLNKLLNPKCLSTFYAVGGLTGLEKGLRTNRQSGLSAEETILEGNISYDEVKPASLKMSPEAATNGSTLRKPTASLSKKMGEESFIDRKRIFSDNRLPVKKGKSLLQLMWITYEIVLIVLPIAIVLSLGVGLYRTFGTDYTPSKPLIGWVEGVTIIITTVIIVTVGLLNDYQKERQFIKLNENKQDRNVIAIRSGKSQEIPVFDILVGDIILISPGDILPADDIFIEGHNVKCDESQATGEPRLLRKRPAEEVFAAIEKGAIERGEDVCKLDPFILSGTKVIEGVGSFLVTSTGVNSSYGKVLMSFREDPEVTIVQWKLNTLTEYIVKLCRAAGLPLFMVLFILFLDRLMNNTATPTEKGQQFLSNFFITVRIIVIIVTLALAFATKRMLKDNNLVSLLKACEVMGNATAICSDKTGTLTQNKMTVMAGILGTSSRFGRVSEPTQENEAQDGHIPAPITDDVPIQEFVNTLTQEVKTLFVQSIVINSTAFEGDLDGKQCFIGSKTETALLSFARDFLGMGSVNEQRANAKIVQLFPFNSKRKFMAVVVQLENSKYRLYVKGASEILLAKCTEMIRNPTNDVSRATITDDHRTTLNNLVTNYAQHSLRTIGLAYQDFDSWPPIEAGPVEGEENQLEFEDIFKQMILLAIIGFQDPLYSHARRAVGAYQKARVCSSMITGDNLTTTKAIATDGGIYTAGGIVMEGPVFRKLSTREKDQIIPSFQVLAHSSHEDKRILVKRLKELGEAVAATGEGTKDARALKSAEVGFSMDISETEVAKEASDIILTGNNFTSIVKALIWGRAINDVITRFLRFKVTVIITAVLLTVISAVSNISEEHVLTAVQLLWVNLIMDTLAALAIATDTPMYLAALTEKATNQASPKLNLQENDHLRAHSPSEHKRAKQLASTIRCFTQQPISGFLVLLHLIHGVTALDIPDLSIASTVGHANVYPKVLFGALILLLSTFFAEHIPSLFGILMGALSIAWIPIRNDPRTSSEVYWAVFASWGVSTVIYGFAQFFKKKMGQPYVLMTLVLTLALVGFNSQMYEKKDIVQGLITCLPPMLSLSVFAVSHVPTLLGWIETLAIHLGISILAIGRLPIRRGEEDGDLEAGILLRDTSSNSPAA